MGLHLSRATPRRAAVLGRPIAHSLSPVLHRAAYEALELSAWTYSAIDCGAEQLAARLAGSGPEWAGFSVTMPGKRAALEAADHVASTAALVGAANTLLRGPDGTWTADNTDVIGIETALRGSGRVDPAAAGPPRWVLLGAGGTAQAAVIAAARFGVPAMDVLVRDRSRAGELFACAERAQVDLVVHELGDARVVDVLASPGVLISTVPPHAADVIADRAWDPGTVLLDVIYAPWPTALAHALHAAGGTVIGGAEILLHQALAQVGLMTGFAVSDVAADEPLRSMRAALTAALAAGR